MKQFLVFLIVSQVCLMSAMLAQSRLDAAMEALHPRIRHLFQTLEASTDLATDECKESLHVLHDLDSCKVLFFDVMKENAMEIIVPKFCEDGGCGHDIRDAAIHIIEACLEDIPDGREVDTEPYKGLIRGSIDAACVKHEGEFCTLKIPKDFKEISAKYSSEEGANQPSMGAALTIVDSARSGKVRHQIFYYYFLALIVI